MKVGIVTHYYHSNNYGGNLQAYALAAYINSLDGFSAEQICFQFSSNNLTLPKTQRESTIKKVMRGLIHPVRFIKKFLWFVFSPSMIKKRINRFLNMFLQRQFSARLKCVQSFNENKIPHSLHVYSQMNIAECNNLYDVFITGSDQVWSGMSDVFSLRFVEDGKKRLSYAASISRKKISTEHQLFLKESLINYQAISVRDETDKRIVSELTTKPVEIVLDPAFLLTSSDWDRIITNNEFNKSRYIFCYLLGDSKSIKRLVKRFSKLKNLPIFYIPHFQDNENSFVKNDIFFGDKKLYNVSPADFVALIKNAEYVFTDSFHAAVFSLIYHKQFFVFDRASKWGNMNSRIISLLTQFNAIERFCIDNRFSIEYLCHCMDIDFGMIDAKIDEYRKASTKFLIDSLEMST